MNQYISIKEFSKLANVSQQAIYKQLNNKLKTYIKVVENKKMLDKIALTEVYKIEIEQPKVEEVKQQFKQKVEEVDNYFNQQIIDIMNQQLLEKDKQIAEMQKLLNQQQQLTMSLQNKLLSIEEKSTQEEKIIEQPIKKHWWNR